MVLSGEPGRATRIASVRAVRPGDLYFLLIPLPFGLGTFLAQHEWLTVIFVAMLLTMLGVLVRFANVIVKEPSFQRCL
jgi:hypothetical protein